MKDGTLIARFNIVLVPIDIGVAINRFGLPRFL